MRKSGFPVAALVLFAVLLATNFYRAATQSIVHDEALTWQLYLAGPASNIFHYYDPNHHFLATVLFRVSTTLFGSSEFAMRLPTLLAGAWFYWTVFRLCALVLGAGWLFLLGCAAITLNPLLLDFMVAARGYGLAIAGLFWALYQMLCWFDDRSNGVADEVLRKRLWKAALGCSIAVATNLTFVIPAAILALAFCVLIVRSSKTPADESKPLSAPAAKTSKKSKKTKPAAARRPVSPYAPLVHVIIPIIVLAVAFLLAAPIDMARSKDFYAGTSTAMKSLQDMMESSFAYGHSAGALHNIEQVCTDIALVFLPVIALAAFILMAARQPWRSTVERATLLSSLAVVGSALLLIGANLTAGIPYPQNRTGIYFIPMASLAALGLARMLAERPGFPRWMGGVISLVLVLFTLEFAAQWNVKSFRVWRYDTDTKRVFQALEAAPKPPTADNAPIRLGVSWIFEPALNYYREVRKATWLAPVERDGFDGARQFYVVSPEDQASAKLPKMKPIYKAPSSGAVLAIPESAQ